MASLNFFVAADPTHETPLELLLCGVQYLRKQLSRAPHHSLVDIMLRREFIELSRIPIFKRPSEGRSAMIIVWLCID